MLPSLSAVYLRRVAPSVSLLHQLGQTITNLTVYHIHDKPVPADLNCTGAGAHLDPYARGESPACDADHKESCQVGDLSGKYGNITTTGYSIA